MIQQNSILYSNPNTLKPLILENFEKSSASSSAKTAKILVNELAVKKNFLLKSRSQKAWTIAKLSVKILFIPMTLLIYIIHRVFSKIAALNVLGNETGTKHINLKEREKLVRLGGQKFFFGFHKKLLLEGMFFPTSCSNAKTKTVLVCTGSHNSYEKSAVPMVSAFKSMGHHVMLFNYEGFGNSEGIASEKGIYRSVEAAYQYLKQEKRCRDENIVAWGYSLGSGAVTDLASKHKIDIVIDRGFSSMSEVVYQEAPRGLKTISRIISLIGAPFNNLKKLKRAKGAILIAQGIDDRMMTKERHGKLLQDAISNNRNAIFMEVNSRHHHTGKVWFEKGEDRVRVEQFLRQ